MRLPRAALAIALALTITAGCFGKSDQPVGKQNVSLGDNNSTQGQKLPDGRDFAAEKETNRTVSNKTLDGQMHMHDYWHGKENVVIFDQDVPTSTSPFERGDQSHFFEAFVNLEKLPGGGDAPALIFEGTGKVVFTITKSPQWAQSYQLSFRTAAKDWSGWTPVDVGKPFTYEPTKIETDMPHSIRSLWNWKLQATGPAPLTGDAGTGVGDNTGHAIHVQIMVYKARNVESWPPHPDFYGGAKDRVVMTNKAGKTNVQNAADVVLYGVEPDQLVPDKLLSMGTGSFDVYVNVSQLTLPPGVPNGGFTLFWRTADTRPDELGIFSKANDTDKTTHAHWLLNINQSVVDSPYQPTSRFGFKLLANPLNDDVAACYRCMPYTIEYTMSIVAHPDPNMTATMTM